MAAAVGVRGDYAAAQLRALARRSEDAGQTRRCWRWRRSMTAGRAAGGARAGAAGGGEGRGGGATKKNLRPDAWGGRGGGGGREGGRRGGAGGGPGGARKKEPPAAGRGAGRDPRRRMISARARPTSSVRSVQPREPPPVWF